MTIFIKEQLHIAILSLHSCPCGKLGSRYTGGMNIYIRNLAAELIQQGHHVDIFTCSHEGDNCCNLKIVGGDINLIHIQASDFSTISESNLNQHVSGLASAVIDYSTTHHLHYNIIHSHYWLSGMVGEQLKAVWDIPHVTMFHTLGKVKNETGLGKIEPQFRINKEKDIINSCDLIIGSTRKEKDSLVNRYGAVAGKVSVIPCGVDPTLFRPFNRQAAREITDIQDDNAILFVGRADPVKGLDNLLEAISLMNNQDCFRLVIIGGDDNSMQEVKEIVNSRDTHGIAAKMNLVGPVPHDRMYLYYNAADFCVIPSYYESFSMVALEAVACGTPILATNVGDVTEISRHCDSCKIITSNSPRILAENLDGMLDALKEPRCTSSHLLPQQYTWHNITERIIENYYLLNSTPVHSGQSMLQRR